MQTLQRNSQIKFATATISHKYSDRVVMDGVRRKVSNENSDWNSYLRISGKLYNEFTIALVWSRRLQLCYSVSVAKQLQADLKLGQLWLPPPFLLFLSQFSPPSPCDWRPPHNHDELLFAIDSRPVNLDPWPAPNGLLSSLFFPILGSLFYCCCSLLLPEKKNTATTAAGKSIY